MFRPVSRVLLRQSLPRTGSFRPSPRISRRLLNTAPPAQGTRSWKSSALRWALAVGGVYYYNTSDVFAESPRLSQKPPVAVAEEAEPLTIESVSARRRVSSRSPTAGQDGQPASTEQKSILKEHEESEDPSDGVQELEEDAGREGAFNPETGEINWDCPCLGGMAHGPCGEEFKAAFSCFVYSKDEPKGMDCIDKFKGMQDCFRKYPEIYGEELDEGEEDGKGENESGDNHGIEDADPSPNSQLSSTTPSESPSQVETTGKVADTLSSSQDSEQQVDEERSRPKAAKQATQPVEPTTEDTLILKAPGDTKSQRDGERINK
ncbi:hypothetical protein FGG08_007169 [Glutinoglossum americanum]|uniref:Mitochondrial intermembrane space import and assembly protein 40 n=1 Tax=Glutinoglossum americanum TaxID=1670608 RepID=A0A9P8HRB6_9PEZI|nr:hypothetical protein FGG08_007169 [Glutinoglossum americanum]